MIELGRANRHAITVPGVSPVTVVTFLATVDRVERFDDAGQVRAYLELVPREYSSGERQQRGHITKAGNSRLRYLLVEAAWGVMRHPRPETAALFLTGDAASQKPISMCWQRWPREPGTRGPRHWSVSGQETTSRSRTKHLVRRISAVVASSGMDHCICALTLIGVLSGCDDAKAVSELVGDEIQQAREGSDALETVARVRGETAEMRRRISPPAVSAVEGLADPSGEIVVFVDGARVRILSPWLLEEWDQHPEWYAARIREGSDWNWLPQSPARPVQEVRAPTDNAPYPMLQEVWERLERDRGLQELLNVQGRRARRGAVDVAVTESTPAGLLVGVVRAAQLTENTEISILVAADGATRALRIEPWDPPSRTGRRRPPPAVYVAVRMLGAVVMTSRGALRPGCERLAATTSEVAVHGLGNAFGERLLACLEKAPLGEDAIIAVSAERDVRAAALIEAMAAARQRSTRVALITVTSGDELIERMVEPTREPDRARMEAEVAALAQQLADQLMRESLGESDGDSAETPE